MRKLLFLIVLCLCLCSCSKTDKDSDEQVITATVVEGSETVEAANPELDSESSAEYRTLWDENYAINNDYIGQVFFESGLINEPVVWYSDNNFYLRKNFKTGEYDVYGTVFEDHNCYYDSQNTILYGHYVYMSYDPNGQDLMFTPLGKLLEEENYEDNKTVYLLLENELREYEIAAVFYCDLYKQGDNWYPNADLIYYYADYDEAYFEKYKTNIREVELYDTGVDFEYTDRFLTLQTCVEGHEDLREIFLCKEVEVYDYQ